MDMQRQPTASIDMSQMSKEEVKQYEDRRPETITEEDDVAFKVLAEHSNDKPITPEEANAVRRKIDMVLMPVMIITYGLNYIDKSIFSTAALFGMVKNLGLFVVIPATKKLDTGKYSYASSFFFAGYICGVPFIAFAAQRFPTGKVAAAAVLCWGIVAICTPAVTNYPGIMAQRFVLGFIESGVVPCFMLITNMFYTKREIALRVCAFYAASGGSFFFSVPIAYGLLQIKQTAIMPWRLLYLFWGSITILWGIAMWFFLPNNSVTAHFLNDRERYVAVERLRSGQSGVENKHFKPAQAIEALTDVKCLLLAAISFTASSANGPVSAFTSLVLQTILGATPLRTLVLTLPSGTIAMVALIVAGTLASNIKNISIFIIVFVDLVVAASACLLWKLPHSNKAGLVAALYLLSMFVSGQILVLGFATGNVAGHTKRSTLSAMVVAMTAAGNIAGPLFFKAKDAPRYPDGFKATLVCLSIAAVLTVIYGLLCWRENKRRDAMGDVARVDHAFHDQTDKENLSFRYRL